MVKHYLAVLLLFLFYPVLGQKASQKILSDSGSSNKLLLKSDFTESSLEGNVYILSTADSTIDVGQILVRKQDFSLVNQEAPDLGMDNRFHWLRFEIQNKSKSFMQLVSFLQNNELTDVCFYIADDRGHITYSQEHFSRKTYINKKPILTRFFAFPIAIEPDQNLTILWRVHRNQGTIVFPFRLYTKDEFLTYSIIYDFFGYISYGVLTFAFLLSAILSLSNKNRLLFYYSGYCLFYILICLSNEGVLIQYFRINNALLDDNIRSIISGILLFFILAFSKRFLQVSIYSPRWFGRFSDYLSYLALAFSFFTIFTPLSSTISAVGTTLVLIVILTVLVMIFFGIAKRQREAFVYLIAIAPFFASSVWYTLSILFNVQTNWFYYQTIPYAPFIEMIILGMELGYKLLHDRDKYFQSLNELQKQFTSSILQTQDSERQRIAADLHDDLGGTIATLTRKITDIKLRLKDHELASEVEELEPLIRKSGDDLRRISHNLMPPEFERTGLCGSLQQLVQTIPGSPTRFEFLTAGSVVKLPLDIELNAYRIVSELIQNIFKHAQATQATVQVLFFEKHLEILVEDNGIGSQQKKDQDAVGMGIKNSTLRADYIGADLRREISSAGTLVVLTIPYPASEENVTFQRTTASK